MNALVRALAVAAALLLGACSATKLAYNNLDWMASWQVGKFVDLDGPSAELFDAGLQSLWRWHRRTQLLLYAADLRELADAADQPMTPAQVQTYIDRAQAHVDRIVDTAAPEAAKVLAALNDRQVAELQERMEKSRSKRHAERLEMTMDELREKSAERMKKSLKRWLGSVSGEQKQSVDQWTQVLQYDPAAEAALGGLWAGAFEDLLSRRAEAETADRLRRLVRDPDLEGIGALRALEAHNRQSGVQFLSDLSRDLAPRQRQYFAKELRQLAQDIEQLAAEETQ